MFRDRTDAGRQLAGHLQQFRNANAVVLALPRGGVVVAYEVSRALSLPLDVIITRKIGAPGNPEYAIGAVAENGETLFNDDEITALGVSPEYLDRELQRQKEEIARRVDFYRGGRGLPSLQDRIAIVVDDGIATGFTTATALKAVNSERPRRTVLAVPVAPPETLHWLARLADEVVCLETPEPFLAVGRFYVDFSQISDEQVRQILDQAGGKERAAQA